MPEDWYRITRPLNLSGFETDGFNEDGRDSFEELLESFIARDVDIYEKRIYIPGDRTRAIIQNVTADAISSANARQILCRIGTLRCGQYVKDGSYTWLVCSPPDNNGVYEKAALWLCKHSIRFTSPISGDIVEYPCYSMNSTQYGTGESRRQIISVVDAQHLLYVPYNEETVLIDNGFRFILDKNVANPTAYRLTQVDSESYSVGEQDGLLQWSIQQDQARAVDDKAGFVADNSNAESRKGGW
jgi:hypothetical protein